MKFHFLSNMNPYLENSNTKRSAYHRGITKLDCGYTYCYVYFSVKSF